MKLNNLQPQFGAKKKSFRKGRGPGSGNGKTGGRGNNGDRARSGYKHKRSFEGGQNPLQRRLPKRGFVSLREGAQEVQLSRLVNLEATAIDASVLAGAGLIGSVSKPVKIIGNSALSKAISFKVDAVTAGARAAIEAAGGKVELIAEAN